MGDITCFDLIADGLDFFHHRNTQLVFAVPGCDVVMTLELEMLI